MEVTDAEQGVDREFQGAELLNSLLGRWRTQHTDQFKHRLGADPRRPTTVTLREKALRVAGICIGTLSPAKPRKNKVLQKSITQTTLKDTREK